MNKIYKYDLGRLSTGLKIVPIDNELNHILDIQEQGTHLMMWVSVGTNIKPQNIIINVRYTGDPEPDATYLKTIQGYDGFVYHIYLEYPVYD